MKSVRVHEQGGPEVLSYDEIDIPSLSPGEILIKVAAIGVNFIDTYQRSGLYQIPLPSTLGLEASGVVSDIGQGCSRFNLGDRVAYTNVAGSYSEYVAVPEDKVVALPNTLSFEHGAAALLQGCTAHFLCHSTFQVKEGDHCLVHAAAGGVGLLLTQMIKMRGGIVIATVSTKEKATLASAAGADHLINYSETNFKHETLAITKGRGVDVVYDSVGHATFHDSIDCLAPLGCMVLYGNASGPVTEFNPALLGKKGSLFLTRPTIFDYMADRTSLEWRSGDLFDWIAKDKLQLRQEHSFELKDASSAHKALEGRKTTGKVILIP